PQLETSTGHYICGFGGCLSYLASYWAANSASFSGWQTKHCESGRSWVSHQSPLALNSAVSFKLHWAQTSSGTPCSSHHQPSWLCSSAETMVGGGDEFGLSVDLLQPVNVTANATSASVE